jgi:hypothetical protein
VAIGSLVRDGTRSIGALTVLMVASVTRESGPNSYNFLTNNCHAHAFAVLESLGIRRSLRSYVGL